MLKLMQSGVISLLFLTTFGLVNYKNLGAIAVSPQQSHVSITKSTTKSTKIIVFENTNSPNRQYAVAWGIPGIDGNYGNIDLGDNNNKLENYLVNTKSNKIIATLHEMKSYPKPVWGGLFTKWSTSSQFLLTIDEAKWAFRAVSLVKNNGTQISIAKKLIADSRSHLAKYDNTAYQANKENLSFEFDRDSNLLKLTDNQLQFPVYIYIAKRFTYERKVLITYQIEKVGTSFNLKLASIKNLKVDYREPK